MAARAHAHKSVRCISLVGVLALGFAARAQPPDPEPLIRAGHWKQARSIVEARLRVAPDDPLAHYLLSQIRFAFGDHISPLALAEEAVALDARVAKYHRQLAEVLGVQAQHAGVIQQLVLARRFRKEIDVALALDPRDFQALRDLLEFHLVAPGIAGGDSRRALATAEQIGEIDKPEGLLAKARIALFRKQAAEAEGFLRDAAGLRPPAYRASIELAEFYLDAGHLDLKAAGVSARRALEIDGGRVDAYNVLAAVYADRADWTALDAILKQASQQTPDDRAPYYHAADRLLGNGRDAARAERYLRAYLAQEPEGNAPTLPQAHWKLGLVLEAQGRQMEAVAEWRQSLRLDPASPAARDLRRVRALRARNESRRDASNLKGA